MGNGDVRTGAPLAGEGARSVATAVEGAGARATAPPVPPPVPGTPPPPGGPGASITPAPRNLVTPSPLPSAPGHTAARSLSYGLHAAVATPSSSITVRLGRYQIIDRIATGGMAEVYLAVHGELAGFRTPVVLKKVLPHLASNPQFIDMFLDEARIASMLDHPNVVRIYEVGKTSSEYFLAMELVQGKPLSALLRRKDVDEREVLEPRLAAFILAQAAAGLHHAHNLTDPLGNSLGLVHRDVSPQNILISFEGSVKVIDFGVARALGRISETQTGGMKGKFGYMSPEQARGEDVDLRTDIFALGVVLWESITGRRLFQRENDLATMRALIYGPIPKPSTVAPVAPELESIVLRALSRNPKLRFQSAAEMGSALEKYVVGAGGASASDLGLLMKTRFSQDHGGWQQTLRTAVNLPAVSESSLNADTTPAPTTATMGPPRRRWPLFLVACAMLGAGIGATLLVTRSTSPEVVPAPAPLPAPPAPPPEPAVQGVPAADPGEDVASGENAVNSESERASEEEPRAASGNGRASSTIKKTNRRRRAGPRSSEPSRKKVERRPNPF